MNGVEIDGGVLCGDGGTFVSFGLGMLATPGLLQFVLLQVGCCWGSIC